MSEESKRSDNVEKAVVSIKFGHPFVVLNLKNILKKCVSWFKFLFTVCYQNMNAKGIMLL